MPRFIRKITGASKDSADENDFYVSGPKHLSRIDWEDEDHLRMVAACLVRGAYVKRLDIKNGVDGSGAALAPPWWENVRFRLHKNIKYHYSSSIGVVYKFDVSKSTHHGDKSPWKAPRIVFAFRGTQNILDGIHDAVLSTQRLEGSSKICKATEETIHTVLQHKNVDSNRCNIWLAGHSLGASIATFIAMRLIERTDTYAETFLFNPPYLRIDPVTIEHDRVRFMIEMLQKKMAVIFAGAMKEASENSSHPKLEAWTPKLFVNPNDQICKGFIRYFENKDYFQGMSPGNLLRVDKGGQILDLDRPFRGVDSLPIYLLPSGKLTMNETLIVIEEGSFIGSVIRGEHVKKMLKAHMLSQWWKDDQLLTHKHYHPADSEQSSCPS